MKGTETHVRRQPGQPGQGHRGVPLVKGTETYSTPPTTCVGVASHRGVPLVKGTETLSSPPSPPTSPPATEASPS